MAKGKPRQVFQEVIRDQFKLHGWNELSAITGRPISTLTKWGSGDTSPTVATMRKVLGLLRLDPIMLEMRPTDFHRLWKLKFLDYTSLQERYKEVGSDPFEASLLVNIVAVMLLRDLSVRGHALELITTETGQPEFKPLYENQLFHGVKLRLMAKPDQGLVMYPAAATGLLAGPALVNLDNIDRLVEGLKKLKDPV